MKAAKKRYYKRIPHAWKVLQSNPRKKTSQEEWEEAWSESMQLFRQEYLAEYTNSMNKIFEAQKESLINTCQSKDHLSDLSANIGLITLPPKM